MNKTFSKLFLIGGLSLLVLAGCQKGLEEKNGGREVRFTVNSVGTKTAYSGQESGGYERIDWVEGDKLIIFSDLAETPEGEKSAVYEITDDISSSGAVSTAKLHSFGESGLRYKDSEEGPYKFASVYPSTGFTLTNGVAKVNTVIEETQSIPSGGGFPVMDHAIMLGAPVEADKDDAVSLSFSPAFTSFQFEVSAERSMKITGFEMKSLERTNGSKTFGPSILRGGFDEVCDLSSATPEWTQSILGSSTLNNIKASFASPLVLTLPEGATKTNTVKFGLVAVPNDITSLSLVFNVEFDENGVTKQETRTMSISYAKDATDGSYSAGDPVTFASNRKHNIKGVVIPANMSTNVVIDLLVIPWEDEDGSVTYGQGQPAITALALEYVSGASVNEGSDRRINNHFAGSDPIKAYFYVFSPVGATWKMKISGDTDKFTVTSPEATSSSATELSGTVGSGTEFPGRVDFTIAKNGATASNKIQFTFSVVVGGREISLNSEIIRGSALTITGESDN